MYNQAYQDVVEDDQLAAKQHERIAIENTIKLMQHSESDSKNSVLRTKAIHLTLQIWRHFINDLASPENAISAELKASIISIGLFILRHLEAMRTNKALNFIPIIEISESIRKGLK